MMAAFWDVKYLGTAAQWFSGVASSAALILAIRVFSRDRNYRERHQAETIFITKYLVLDFDPKSWSFGRVVVTGYNGSDQYIRLPRLEARPVKLKKIGANQALHANYAELQSELRRNPENELVVRAFKANRKDLAPVVLDEPAWYVLPDGQRVSFVDMLLALNKHDPIEAYRTVDPRVKFELTIALPVGFGGYEIYLYFIDASNRHWKRNVFTDQMRQVVYPTNKWLLKWAKYARKTVSNALSRLGARPTAHNVRLAQDSRTSPSA